MKRNILTVVLALCLLSGGLQARDYYYFCQDSVRIDLQTCDSIVNVLLDESFADRNPLELALDHEGLLDDYTPYQSHFGYWTYGVVPDYNYDNLLGDLRDDPQVEFAAPVFQVEDTLEIYEGNEILVGFHESTSTFTIESIIAFHGLEIVLPPSNIQFSYLLKTTSYSMEEVLDICNDIYGTGYAEYAVPNFAGDLIKPQYAPNDEYYDDWEWHLRGVHGIKMEEAWDYEEGKYDAVIGIVDTGFDLDHEDLDPERYVWPFDAAGVDHNLHGFDFVPSIPDLGAQLPFGYWHGTPALGVFGAKTDNEIGVASIAGHLRKCPIKVWDDNQGTSKLALEWAMWWPFDANVDVALVTYNQVLPYANVIKAIQRSSKFGVAWIAPAGNNDGPAGFPANMPEVLAVTGTNFNGYPIGYASGNAIDLSAPASGIATLDITGPGGWSNGNICMTDADYTCDFGGTSAAAAQVAGVAALLVSRRPELLCNDCTPELLYDVLRGTATDVTSNGLPVGWDEQTGSGILNAQKAVLAVSHGDANNDGQFSIGDAVFIINFIFGGGPAPSPQPLMGDADGSGGLSIGDAVFMINYVFGGGPAPVILY